MLNRSLVAFTLLTVLVTATPARADLIDLGKGLIYDTVQDLTWLQDLRLAGQSSGDADGLVAWTPSIDLQRRQIAADFTYAGFDDWRLPTVLGGSYYDNQSSEVSVLMAQLGWHWDHGYPLLPGEGEARYLPGSWGPFINPAYLVWVDRGGSSSPCCLYWAADRDVDPGPDMYAPAALWAVRDGNARPEAQRVPEPSTLIVIGLGCAMALCTRRLGLKQHNLEPSSGRSLATTEKSGVWP